MIFMFRILQLDLPFYATIALLLLMHYYRKQRITDGVSGKFFLTIIYTLLLSTLLSIVSILMDGQNYRLAYQLNTPLIYIRHLFSILPLIAWYIYYEYKITYSLHSVKKQFNHYVFYIISILILLFINSRYQLFFSIDSSNLFQTSKSYFILYLPLYGSCIHFILHILHNLENIQDNVLKNILYYFLIPITASIIQLLYTGIAIIWPSVVMITVVAFIKLERSELLTDSLTNLYTRRYIDTEIHHLLHTNKPFTLILIDMDKFKSINDSYGHTAGDQALVVMSSILKANIKYKDIISRYGGDEFLILLPSGNPFIGDIVTTRLLGELLSYNNKNLVPYKLAFSFGIHFVDSGTTRSVKDLLKEVDMKMYQQKKSKTL